MTKIVYTTSSPGWSSISSRLSSISTRFSIVGLGRDLLMNIGLSRDLYMDIGLSGDLLVHIGNLLRS